jgi:hypothetical protein
MWTILLFPIDILDLSKPIKFTMRDAHSIKGEIITYKNENYEIGDVYFIPENPELYIQLIRHGGSLNVRLNEIIHLITSPKKILVNI